jgi:precorrin-6A/cobalt-precorrin-6A reductase
MKVLILGGTAEASALARSLADCNADFILSLAGVTQSPRQPAPFRTGGFGGVAGLRAYLAEAKITHVVDATHPFAVQMSAHAALACADRGVPLVQLSRPAWQAEAGDDWREVETVEAAAAAMGAAPRRVFLSHGKEITPFAAYPQHVYLIRTIDPPQGLAALPQRRLILARGPFDFADERDLLRNKKIDLIISKNSGGEATYAKIEAARALKIPVILIRRPAPQACAQAHSVADVRTWLESHGLIP